MVAILQPSNSASITWAAAATYYNPVGCTAILLNTTEANAQVIYRTGGTFTSLCAQVTANANTGTTTFRFRKNGANGNQVVSVSASTSGVFLDSTNSDSVLTSDSVNYSMATVATGSITVSVLSVVFSSSSNSVIKLMQWGSGVSETTASDTLYVGSAGAQSAGHTETSVQFKGQGTASLENLFVRMSANTWGTATTVRSRINTANGNLVISVPASSTGYFEDLSHSDSLVNGNLFNCSLTTGTGTGSYTYLAVGLDYVTTNNTAQYVTGSLNRSTVLSTTYYFPLGGSNQPLYTTETSAQVQANFVHTASNLGLLISPNSVTSTATLNFRKNGINGNQTISIPTSTSGHFNDATHSDSIIATDKINCQFIQGTTGTSNQIFNLGYLATAPSSAKAKSQSSCFWSYPV